MQHHAESPLYTHNACGLSQTRGDDIRRLPGQLCVQSINQTAYLRRSVDGGWPRLAVAVRQVVLLQVMSPPSITRQLQVSGRHDILISVENRTSSLALSIAGPPCTTHSDNGTTITPLCVSCEKQKEKLRAFQDLFKTCKTYQASKPVLLLKPLSIASLVLCATRGVGNRRPRRVSLTRCCGHSKSW